MSLERWSKNWGGPSKRQTIGEKFRNFINPPGPIRHQVVNAIYRLTAQINKLEYSLSKLQAYDKQLFEKTVNALIEGDKAKARMYANEVAEIRKMAKIILTVRHALEKVKIRLDTYLIVGDVQANLAPAVVALKGVAGYLKGMMPDVFTELMEIDEALQATMMQTAVAAPAMVGGEVVTEEAQKILKDAAIVAEQRLKQNFPELPVLEGAPAQSSLPGQASVEEGK
ncbi:MAG: Snf7 family protein [Desulfurococcales archaeon]|nr:Snf7 family protein [Desulfurococcales archaeon]